MSFKYVHLFNILFIISFLFSNSLNAVEYCDYEFYVNQISREFANEVKKDFNFYCRGSGGSMPFDVQEISLSFGCYGTTNVETIRKLELVLVDRLLNKINTHEKIRPFLRTYPFDHKSIEVSLRFYTNENRLQSEGVAGISLINGKFYYRKISKDGNEITDLFVETYEEAVKLANETP